MTKAIIPAAGWGTRMLPAAKAVPKELLPILDRPTIQYVVEEAADAGIDDVLLITQREKRAIEDHFDRNAELEDRLRVSKKSAFLESVTKLAARVQIHAVRQSEQRGLGHAVLQAARHVGDASCLCLLGDTIFSGDVSPSRQLLEAHVALGGVGTLVALEEVPADRVDRYGIAAGALVGDRLFRIDDLVEKPSVAAAPSRLAICARYVLSPTIFELLRSTAPGKGGEIQLTDALKAAIAREPVHGVILRSKRHDIGNPADWLLTNILYASRDAALWKRVEPALRALLS